MKFLLTFLLVSNIVTLFFFIRCKRKNEQHKKECQKYFSLMSRFHDITTLSMEFGFFTNPFYFYVKHGGHIEQVRDEIRFNFDRVKNDLVEHAVKEDALSQVKAVVLEHTKDSAEPIRIS